jgi:hypothetical protein
MAAFAKSWRREERARHGGPKRPGKATEGNLLARHRAAPSPLVCSSNALRG